MIYEFEPKLRPDCWNEKMIRSKFGSKFRSKTGFGLRTLFFASVNGICGIQLMITTLSSEVSQVITRDFFSFLEAAIKF